MTDSGFPAPPGQPPGDLYTGSPLRLDPDASEALRRHFSEAWRRLVEREFPRVYAARGEAIAFLNRVEREIDGGADVGAVFDALRDGLR